MDKNGTYGKIIKSTSLGSAKSHLAHHHPNFLPRRSFFAEQEQVNRTRFFNIWEGWLVRLVEVCGGQLLVPEARSIVSVLAHQHFPIYYYIPN